MRGDTTTGIVLIVPAVYSSYSSRLRDVPDDVAEMHHTHEAARTLGAPDLKACSLWRDAKSGNATESMKGRSAVLASQLADRARAQISLHRRPVEGWWKRCGHQRTAATTYTTAQGKERCRVCRNEAKRQARNEVRMREMEDAARLRHLLDDPLDGAA